MVVQRVILQDHCIILHMPKTGGVFVRMLLEKHYGSAVQLASGKSFRDRSAPTAQHHSISEVPEESRGLPAFGLVRNPWDWYVSWYHFFMEYPYRPPHFMTVSEGKTVDFAGFVGNLRKYPPDSPEYLSNTFSAEYFRIFACSASRPRNPEVEMGRYESVHDDVHSFLSRAGVRSECLDEIATFRRINPSPHRHYSTYYTPGLAEQIYAHDRVVIDEFGYGFEASD